MDLVQSKETFAQEMLIFFSDFPTETKQHKTTNGSGQGLSSIQRQTIVKTNGDFLVNGP